MRDYPHLYIDGAWVAPSGGGAIEVVNPATEELAGRVAAGTVEDVDRAVAAARRAFPGWAASSRAERLDLLRAIQDVYARRQAELGDAITEEMGAPRALAQGFHVGLGAGHLQTAIEVLGDFAFDERRGATMIAREPVGVCALITPWNWPMNQTCVKIFPALATGCTTVLKPPQLAPFSAQILAEILDEAGVPAGVFNMVQGSGSVVGAALAAHPDVDMVSFTGSEAVGAQIGRDAAATIKRVGLELGGKSPFVVLDDAAMADNVSAATAAMMGNSGQTCSAGSRLLVPAARMAEAEAAAKAAAEAVTVGDPASDAAMGPVVSKAQFESVQAYIRRGVEEGARLIAGGPGRPEGVTRGWFVRPTVFAGTNDMAIAREEVFGPVLVLIGYDDLDDAVAIANDTDFGLAGYVNGLDAERCRSVARRLRTGWVSINGGFDFHAPFGGYKRSGNGREWGEHGFLEYLEVKSMLGYAPA